MDESSRSSPAFSSAHTSEQDQFASHSNIVGSRVGTPNPDRHSLYAPQSLTSSQITPERSTLHIHSFADPDQASLRPHTATRVEGQCEIIPSSGVGRESQDTVTRPPNSGTPTHATQSKNTAFPATPTSRQVLTGPFSSQDGHDISSPEADIARSITNPAEKRRHAPLPPLPRASSPGISQSINSSLTNPHYIRHLQYIGSPILSSGFDRSIGTVGATSHSNMIPSSSVCSAKTPGVVPVSGHGLGTPGMSVDDSIRLDAATHRSYPTFDRSRTLRSRTDWLVPGEEKEKTVGERLDPTLDTARIERDKYAFKAKITGYTLNIAIGLQVFIGALTTGLSAATTGRQTSIMTAILGGIATLIASYLARARGSHEPELSTARVKDLEQFIRDCEVFQLDHGRTIGSSNPEQETRLNELRERFEELLGNGNGERRLAPPA